MKFPDYYGVKKEKVKKTNLPIGTKVKYEYMYTKRMRTRYIVSKKSGGRYGVSTCPTCGESGTIHWSDIEEYKLPKK